MLSNFCNLIPALNIGYASCPKVATIIISSQSYQHQE